MIRRAACTRAHLRGLWAWSLCLAPFAAPAAPWYVEPDLTASAVYQTNPQLYVDEARSGSGAIATLDLPFTWSDGASSLVLHPVANAGFARGATGLGEHNRSISGSGNHAGDSGSVRGNFELDHTDLFGPKANDLGVVRPVGYAQSDYYSGGATWLASELTSVDLDAARSAVSYHTEGPSPYVDYIYNTYIGKLTHVATEKLQALVTLSYSDFSPLKGVFGTRERSLQVGGAYRFNDYVKATVTFGRSNPVRKVDRLSTQGLVYSAQLTDTHPRTTLTLSASQSRQPGALGRGLARVG